MCECDLTHVEEIMVSVVPRIVQITSDFAVQFLDRLEQNYSDATLNECEAGLFLIPLVIKQRPDLAQTLWKLLSRGCQDSRSPQRQARSLRQAIYVARQHTYFLNGDWCGTGLGDVCDDGPLQKLNMLR